MIPFLTLAGCPYIDASEEQRRLDPDGDGVNWPADCDDRDPYVGACSGETASDETTPSEPPPSVEERAAAAIEPAATGETLGADGLDFLDHDNDGFSDLAYTAGVGDGGAEVRIHLAPLTEAHATIEISRPAGEGFGVLASADLDGSGYRDDLIMEVRTDGRSTGAYVAHADGAWLAIGGTDDGACGSALASLRAGETGQVVVGCPEAVLGEGIVAVLDGTPSGTVYVLDELTLTAPDATGLGRALANAQDVDGDGDDDLLLAAEHAAWLVWGPVDRNLSLPALGDGTSAVAIRVAPDDPAPGVVGCGDLDGDGYGDWAVVLPADERVVVRSGNSKRAQTEAGTLLPAAEGGDFGISAERAGDIDNDGRQDILVGAPGYADGAGAIYLFPGPIEGSVQAEPSAMGRPGDALGSRSTGGGRLDDDSTGDMAVASATAIFLLVGDR